MNLVMSSPIPGSPAWTSLMLRTQETIVTENSFILMMSRCDIHDTVFIVLKLIDDDCDLMFSVLGNGCNNAAIASLTGAI